LMATKMNSNQNQIFLNLFEKIYLSED